MNLYFYISVFILADRDRIINKQKNKHLCKDVLEDIYVYICIYMERDQSIDRWI